jgi:hypothetical protein
MTGIGAGSGLICALSVAADFFEVNGSAQLTLVSINGVGVRVRGVSPLCAPSVAADLL